MPPSGEMIELIASAKVLSKQLEDCINLTRLLPEHPPLGNEKEGDDWISTYTLMQSLQSDLRRKIKKHEEWARNWE